MPLAQQQTTVIPSLLHQQEVNSTQTSSLWNRLPRCCFFDIKLFKHRVNRFLPPYPYKLALNVSLYFEWPMGLLQGEPYCIKYIGLVDFTTYYPLFGHFMSYSVFPFFSYYGAYTQIEFHSDRCNLTAKEVSISRGKKTRNWNFRCLAVISKSEKKATKVNPTRQHDVGPRGRLAATSVYHQQSKRNCFYSNHFLYFSHTLPNCLYYPVQSAKSKTNIAPIYPQHPVYVPNVVIAGIILETSSLCR